MIYDFNLNVGDTFSPAGHPVNIVDVSMEEVDGNCENILRMNMTRIHFLKEQEQPVVCVESWHIRLLIG